MASRQRRWPAGTPVGPGGKGPGGGRFRGYRVAGFHGRYDGRFPGDLDMVFVDPQREGAEMYAEDVNPGARGALYEVSYDAQNPLHIRDAREFKRLWHESGAHLVEGRFHAAPGQPSNSRTFQEWVRAQGYDAVILHPEAFEASGPGTEWTDEDQDAWEWIRGTYGDPQSVILNPSRASFTRIGGGDWADTVGGRLPAPRVDGDFE